MTYRGHRVVVFIPFGRELTVSVLVPYLVREHRRGLLDEVMLCMNLDGDQEREGVERRYAESLAAEHPSLFRLYERPGPDTAPDALIPLRWRRGFDTPKQLNTGRFYWYMQDPKTVYVRMDDDLVWLHPRALQRLVDFQLDPESTGYLAAFPVIWNNAVTSFYLQRYRHRGDRSFPFPERPLVKANAVDPVGWGSFEFARTVHEHLLDVLEDDRSDDVLIDETWKLRRGRQFSVSCFSISGRVFDDLGGVLSWPEEEHWLTQHYPSRERLDNALLGDAHVAHFSFFPQRRRLLEETTVLDRYRALSETVL